MHPGMMHWWKVRQRAAECGIHLDDGHGDHRGYGRHRHHHERAHHAAPHHGGDDLGGALGVRRPLRFLGYKLGLDDDQVAQFARILSDLKTERAQAEVDSRRTLAAFADAVGGDTFDTERATHGADLRVRSAEQLRTVIVKSLSEIHALLRPEQRERLAYLIRTGTLTL